MAASNHLSLDKYKLLFSVQLKSTQEQIAGPFTYSDYSYWMLVNGHKFIPLAFVVETNLKGSDCIRVEVSDTRDITQRIMMAIMEAILFKAESETDLDAEDAYYVAATAAVDAAVDIVNNYKESLMPSPRYCKAVAVDRLESASAEYHYAASELAELLVEGRLLLDKIGLDIASNTYLQAFTRQPLSMRYSS